LGLRKAAGTFYSLGCKRYSTRFALHTSLMSQTEKALCISLIGNEARTGIQQEVRPLIELAWPQRLNHKQRVALANAYIAIMVASITYFSIHPADAKEYFLL
jgi:hypothetical protein